MRSRGGRIGCITISVSSAEHLAATRAISFVYILTWLIAALLCVSSMTGLVYGTSGFYDPDPVILPALLGQDAVALVFGVPLLIGSAWLARRGSVRAIVCWIGALFYVAYFYYFNVLGIRLNPMFFGYIAIVSMSVYGALALLFALDLDQVRETFETSAPIRWIGAFLVATPILFGTLWTTLTLSVLESGHDLDPVSRLVVAIDGVVLLPLMFFGGLWLWRRQPLGFALAGILLVKTTATFLTLAATTVATAYSGQPVDPFQSVMYVAGVVIAGTLLILYMYPAAFRVRVIL
jgi:hypothetical protein